MLFIINLGHLIITTKLAKLFLSISSQVTTELQYLTKILKFNVLGDYCRASPLIINCL